MHFSAGRRRERAHLVPYQRNMGPDNIVGGDDEEEEVQFEDPEWWKHLPSLKCIGLACLLLEEKWQSKSTRNPGGHETFLLILLNNITNKACPLSSVEASLVDHICNDESERKHLKLLAQCIGFETFPSDIGVRGDLSCFSRTEEASHIINHLSPTANAVGLACVGIEGVASRLPAFHGCKCCVRSRREVWGRLGLRKWLR